MSASQEAKVPLSRERIVSTALALVDAEGLDALSMRRLGAELGVDPMAVYHYIPNKAALNDAIVEAVMAEIDLSIDDPSAPPEERLVCVAKAYAEVLFRHANTLPVLLTRGPATPASFAPIELVVGIFREAGLSVEHAISGMNVVAAMVRGYVAMVATDMADPERRDPEAVAALMTPEEFPYLHEAAQMPQRDPREMFELGIRSVAMGLLGTE